MRQWIGCMMMVLAVLASVNGSIAGAGLDFQVTHRVQLSFRGPVHTMQQAEAEIRNGHQGPRERQGELTFTPLGYVTEQIGYTTGSKVSEICEHEVLTYTYDERGLPCKVEELSTSTYKDQRQNSVYTLSRNATGQLTEVSYTATDAESPLFDDQTWKNTYRYDRHGRLMEKSSWVEADGVKRPDTVELQRYIPKPDGILIEKIGQEGRWKGKVTSRTWLDAQGKTLREYMLDEKGHPVEKSFYAYNGHGDIVKQVRTSKAGKTTITYRYVHYDTQGNWTERVESWAQWGVAKGASIPHRITYRTFTYYSGESAQKQPNSRRRSNPTTG